MLTKDEIIAADDLQVEVVQVGAWGGEVRIRTMTGTERDAFMFEAAERKEQGRAWDNEGLMARFLVRVLLNGDGSRLFADDEVDQLQAKSSKVLDGLFQKASALSAFTEESQEELLGNSPDPTSGDSGSG